MSKPPVKIVQAQNLDASALIDIYLDGVCTGAASMALQVGLPEDRADAIADEVVRVLTSDPAAMECVRKEVIERIQGIPGSPYTFTAHVLGPGS